MSEALRLRRAAEGDCRFVWETNNDPDVRAQSIRTGSIPLADHEAWFAAKLASRDAALWIAETDRPIGVVRCDRRGAHAEISVALAAAARGRGLGSEVIARATESAISVLDVGLVVAMVRPENAASRRAFEKAGYRAIGPETREGVDLVRYERERA